MGGDAGGDFVDGGGDSGADVDGELGGGKIFSGDSEGGDGGRDGVGDEDEVAGFFAVFKDVEGLLRAGGVGKDGEDAGVGIGERLTGAVDILIAESDGGDRKGAAEEQGHLLLDLFGEAVEGAGREGRGFLGGGGSEGGGADRADGIKVGGGFGGGFFCGGAGGGEDGGVGGAGVGSLAVDGAGGGGDDAADGESGAIGNEEFEQERGAADVGSLVAGDFVHGLAGAGFGGEVEDGVGCLEGGGEDLGVGDVAAEDAELSVGRGRGEGRGEGGEEGREFSVGG